MNINRINEYVFVQLQLVSRLVLGGVTQRVHVSLSLETLVTVECVNILSILCRYLIAVFGFERVFFDVILLKK